MTDDALTTPLEQTGNSVLDVEPADDGIDPPFRVSLEGHVIKIHSREKEADILRSFGTSSNEFFNGLVLRLHQTFNDDGWIGKNQLDFALGYIRSMKPRDETEALLLAQMTMIHTATHRSYRNYFEAKLVPQYDSAEKTLNKLARTFTTQVEALKRYRTGGEQKVTVQHQHVNVSEGGQAIVGNVGAPGGGGAKSRGTTP